MTPEQREAIKARADKATAGPWAYRPQEYDDWGWVRGNDGIVATARNPDVHLDDFFKFRNENRDPYESNASFIAHARQDIPDLLAALEAAERERDKAEEERNALFFSRENAIAERAKAERERNDTQVDLAITGQVLAVERKKVTALEAERDALKEDRDSIIRGAMLLEQKLKAELADAVGKVAKYEMEAFKEMQHQAEAAKLRKSIPILPRRALEAKP